MKYNTNNRVGCLIDVVVPPGKAICLLELPVGCKDAEQFMDILMAKINQTPSQESSFTGPELEVIEALKRAAWTSVVNHLGFKPVKYFDEQGLDKMLEQQARAANGPLN